MFSQGPKQPLKVTIIYPVIEASQKELKRTISHWHTARNSNLIFCIYFLNLRENVPK